jgi:predicted amidohydrolase YtcJ
MGLKLSVLDQSVAMSVMISRCNPLVLVPVYEVEEQAIRLVEALTLLTTQAVRSMGLERVIGGLKTGFAADFRRLAKPLQKQTPEEIAKTEVLEAYSYCPDSGHPLPVQSN